MQKSEFKNAIILVIDGLNAGMLGPYGNTCIETDFFNRLASESVVFEQAISASPDLHASCQSFWNGGSGKLLEHLAENGIRTELVSDDEELLNWDLVGEFEAAIQVPTRPVVESASDLNETRLANFFAHASQWLAGWERGAFGWIHCQGLFGPWDAPYSLRVQLADSEDPMPIDFFQAPATFLEQDSDPDDLLAIQQAWSAQMHLIDRFAEVLWKQLRQSDLGPTTLFGITSARGFPLGEHGLVGNGPNNNRVSLNNESIHVPLILNFPPGKEFDDFRCARIGNLISSHLVTDLLKGWFDDSESVAMTLGNMLNALPTKSKEFVSVTAGEHYCLQTHAWKLLASLQDEDSNQLFAKPDDVWEANDVSRRCSQIVEELKDLYRQIQAEKLKTLEIPIELCERTE